MKYVNNKIVYEAGDWVVSIGEVEGYRKDGQVFQVIRMSGESLYYEPYTNAHQRNFRPATQEEIEKAIKPVFKTKDKYEIGDWVTRIGGEFGGMQVGDTGQVIGINYQNVIISRYWTEGQKGHDSKKLRLATEDEIREASKFQKGDWVALLALNKKDVEAVVQLTKVDDDNLYYEPYDGMSFGCWGNCNDGRVRFATWNEIQKALKDKEIKIGEHTVEFDLPKRIVKVGCQSYPYDDVVTLHRIMTKLDIKSITHSKIVEAIQYVTIDKIYNRIKDAGS